MYTLVDKGCHDECETIIYYQIIDDLGKVCWESSWVDVRDLDDDFDKELKEACHKFGIEK